MTRTGPDFSIFLLSAKKKAMTTPVSLLGGATLREGGEDEPREVRQASCAGKVANLTVAFQLLLVLAVAAALAAPSRGEIPAIQVAVTEEALQYGAKAGREWIRGRLEDISIPDISGGFFILFDTLHYTLTGITITRLDFPEPSVEFYQETTGLKTSIDDLSVTLTGQWMTEFGIIQDGGSFDMTVSEVDVTFVVRLGREVDGHPLITGVSCEARVGDVDMRFHDGASWIFQPFVSEFEGRAKGEIEDKICSQLDESITKLDYLLLSRNVSFDVNKDMMIDLPLTDDPVVDASSLNVGLKGVFYSIKTQVEPPFQPQPFTLPEQPDYMLSLGVSEFTLNSASYAYYSAGLLQLLINDSMIPSYSPVHLNTSSFGMFVPQLPKLYPGLLMNLQVYAREVPLASFQPGLVKLGLQGAVKAFAIQPNGTQVPLFTLNTDSEFRGKVWIAGRSLKGSAQMTNLMLTLQATEIGTFETGELQKVARMGAALAMTKVNQRLGEGVGLPSLEQAELVNTTVEVKTGFITVSSDVQVSLTDRKFN